MKCNTCGQSESSHQIITCGDSVDGMPTKQSKAIDIKDIVRSCAVDVINGIKKVNPMFNQHMQESYMAFAEIIARKVEQEMKGSDEGKKRSSKIQNV